MESKYQKNIIRPIITEKNTALNQNNKYIFEVSIKANKIEIAKEFERIYKLKPVKINIVNLGGKNVKYGKTFGKTKRRKKAIITLKKGEKIDFTSA